MVNNLLSDLVKFSRQWTFEFICTCINITLCIFVNDRFKIMKIIDGLPLSISFSFITLNI